MMRLVEDYDRILDNEILLELNRWVADEKQCDLQSLDVAQWRPAMQATGTG